MELAIAIATLINAVTPGVAQIILMIKKTDGTIGIVPMLNEADTNFKANIKQVQDWLAAHPKP